VSTVKLPTFRVYMVPSFSGPIFLRLFDPVDKGRALLRNIGRFVSVDTALSVRRFEV
jgi:hypothetical protein